ncbi:hypothetical protein DACRYDRAFT_100463 [Dacryopinax primogenitus]|uniref:Concanavalin A-like lectin/glucanase n=1 Tax=Dacryopinax primogenitus (strain DJM 731) TaxID=1858805 RepID=M5G0H6_DACPD|nr:uncharacterized protein DACRYDRAFT_100463 [Dacryopinax primogenitus]EJU01635.1 hypothetical protein DACRYDRAFT_100463 [Dacryopinax primogenitus]
MRSLLSLVPLALLARSAYGISWSLILGNDNTWVQQKYTVTVPPPPPAGVTDGPWYFWCGLQPSGGGVIQPVLGWKTSENNIINPGASFPHVWAMNLWSLPWNYGQDGAPTTQESAGIWADQGAQIASTVTWENGQWYQQANVLNGQAAGQTVEMYTPASYFLGDNASGDNTPMTVCESELDGGQTSQWDFSVTFTDIYFEAASSDGVESLCASAIDHSDGNGYISFTGFSMIDNKTCYWSSITLSPQ